jgi:hypothetical protein
MESERCKYHDDLVCDTAKTTALITELRKEVALLREAVDELTAFLNQTRGAGWIVFKVGAMATGVAAVVYTLYRIFTGK